MYCHLMYWTQILAPNVLDSDVLASNVLDSDVLVPNESVPKILAPNVLTSDVLVPNVPVSKVLAPNVLDSDVLTCNVLTINLVHPDVSLVFGDFNLTQPAGVRMCGSLHPCNAERSAGGSADVRVSSPLQCRAECWR